MGLSFGCSALHGKDNAISDVERGDSAFVPLYISMVPVFTNES